MKIPTCCFSGHRILPKNEMGNIEKRLRTEIDYFINKGVTDFISGGALGFDLMAAALIADKKEMGAAIRLIFMLPCLIANEL